ncbi:MAG: hypothetical protein R3D97_08795 [Paracoccaceae bacterium]
MQEAISIATMFLLLAFAGLERAPVESVKSCRTGLVQEVLGGC